MRILVAYASRHGATQGIAERITEVLTASGHDAEARPVKDVADLAGYDAFVIGSAVYMFHWLKDMTRFLRRNGPLLADRPLWLFSSGPLGTEMTDAKGRDVLEARRPRRPSSSRRPSTRGATRCSSAPTSAASRWASPSASWRRCPPLATPCRRATSATGRPSKQGGGHRP